MRFGPWCVRETCVALLLLPTLAVAAKPGMAAARRARDRGDAAALGVLAQRANREAARANTLAAYVRAAKFDAWWAEAGQDHYQNSVVEQAAKAGAAVAAKAVQVAPASSQAHAYLAEFQGELIPLVANGGMRYGFSATAAAEKAVALDPDNPHAYIVRGVMYLFTPAEFGGSKAQAVVTIKKAVALAPNDSTTYLWLAQAEAMAGDHQAAVAAIRRAEALDPERLAVKIVARHLASPAK